MVFTGMVTHDFSIFRGGVNPHLCRKIVFMFVFTCWAGMETFMPYPHGLFLTQMSLTTHPPSLALDTSEITNAAGQGTLH